MKIVPGIQLSALRSFPPLSARLQEVVALGYAEAEPDDTLFTNPAYLQAMLAQSKLKTPSIQVGLPRFRADVQQPIGLADTLAASVVVIPGPGVDDRLPDTPAWMRLGAEISGYAIKLQTVGKRLAWQNREADLALLPDGSRGIEHLFDASDDILWEVDVAAVVRAGEDPTEWIQRYPDRIVAVHLKDIAESASGTGQVWADLGHGMLDWGLIVPSLKKSSCEHWYADHGAPLDFDRFARRAIETMEGW